MGTIRTAVLAAAVTAAWLGLAAAARAADDVASATVTLKKGDKIIFFGDSLTELAGKEEPKTFVTRGYVRIVRETLQATHKDLGLEVEWVATGGHTAEHGRGLRPRVAGVTPRDLELVASPTSAAEPLSAAEHQRPHRVGCAGGVGRSGLPADDRVRRHRRPVVCGQGADVT